LRIEPLLEKLEYNQPRSATPDVGY